MRQRILALLALGKTYNQIVAEVGCAKSTVAYYAKNVKPPPDYKVHNWAEVQRFYDEGNSGRQCMACFGICHAVWYSAKKSGKIVTRDDHRIPLEVLLSPGRGTTRASIKPRLIQAGLLTEKCARCGIMEWLGQPLSLELHHVNGVNSDHRLENLQLLCPNCHSQTDTYGGRNAKKITKNNAG
jgi:5-methylcytosine-specific restriction endonuclease McrA